MPISIKNYIRQGYSIVPYKDSTTAALVKNNTEAILNGTVQATLIPSSLDTEDYLSIVQSKAQQGYFTSLEDKRIYNINQEGNEKNLIKDNETLIGNVYSYLSDISESIKKSFVKDNIVSSNPSESSEDGYSNQSQVDDTSKTQENPKVAPSEPYTIIRESRTGTASYEDINGGVFSYNDQSVDLVEIHCLQRVERLNYGTRQEFDKEAPRGSQTPLFFYKNQSARSISFECSFHQQEFPLEPLHSIAEKAQYLARPYRHGDFSVIPKLVEVLFPGRVFRGYLSSVSCQMTGDDYHSWNREDIQSQVNPSLENQYLGGRGFYAGYQSRELTEDNASSREYLSNEALYYYLSSMTITFELDIVEEIKLTLYQTQAEWDAYQNNKVVQAEQERIQSEWNEARERVESLRPTTPEFAPYQNDDLIWVYPNGEVCGVASADNLTPPEGCITLTEYLKTQEVKNSNPPNPLSGIPVEEELATLSSPESRFDLISQIEKLIDDLGLTEPSKEDLPKMTTNELWEWRQEIEVYVSKENTDMIDFVSLFNEVMPQPDGNDQLKNVFEQMLPNMKKILVVEIKDLESIQQFLQLIALNNEVTNFKKTFSHDGSRQHFWQPYINSSYSRYTPHLIFSFTGFHGKDASFLYYKKNYPSGSGRGFTPVYYCGPISEDNEFGITSNKSGAFSSIEDNICFDFSLVSDSLIPSRTRALLLDKLDHKKYLFTNFITTKTSDLDNLFNVYDKETNKFDDSPKAFLVKAFKYIQSNICTQYYNGIVTYFDKNPNIEQCVPELDYARKKGYKSFLCVFPENAGY